MKILKTLWMWGVRAVTILVTSKLSIFVGQQIKKNIMKVGSAFG
jgi:hypothetical protein